MLVEKYRQLRQEDSGGVGKNSYRITVRQLESMIRLSEAIARANCQHDVSATLVFQTFSLHSPCPTCGLRPPFALLDLPRSLPQWSARRSPSSASRSSTSRRTTSTLTTTTQMTPRSSHPSRTWRSTMRRGTPRTWPPPRRSSRPLLLLSPHRKQQQLHLLREWLRQWRGRS